MSRPPICPRLLLFAFLALLVLSGETAVAQLPAGTTDASSSSQDANSSIRAESDRRLRSDAAAALERNDFVSALKSLAGLVELHPTDARILFDLGSTQDALDQISQAEQTYRRSISADPNYLQPHLALGLLLARNKRNAEAQKELSAAAGMASGGPELRGRAFRALAHLDAEQNPAEALEALIAALQLTPETSDDTLLSANLAERADDEPAAEAAYRRMLTKQPQDPSATAALARLLLRNNKTAEAETAIQGALSAHPADPVLSAELASTYIKQGAPDKAVALLAPLHAAHSDETSLTRMYAHVLSQTGDYGSAEPLFAELRQQAPTDPALADDDADALIHLKRYPEAERLLKVAVQTPTAFPTREEFAGAASHLAFAASQNNDPETVLQATALRATVLPQSPASLFLEAIARDKLHQNKEAQSLYRQFLSVANGKFPDEEWEAHHRLLALEHTR